MTPDEIRSIRSKLGLTRGGFAERMQVSYHTIVSWELGRTTPGGPAIALLDQLASMAARKSPTLGLTGEDDVV